MAGKNDIVAGIRLEGERQFRSSVTSINKSVTSLKSELNLIKAQYDGNQNSMEALTKKGEVLNKILEQQKQKVEATKQGLENATRAYESGGKKIQEMEKACSAQEEKLEELNKTYQQARQKLEELEKANGSSSDAVKEQQEAVKKLEEELNDQNTAVTKAKTELSRCQTEYQKTGNKVEDWKTKLNTAEAQVIKANNAVAENARYMDEAAASADKCAKSIDEYGKAVKGPAMATIDKKDAWFAAGAAKAADVAVNALGQVVDKAAQAIQYAANVGSSFEAGMSEVAAISGATGTQLQALTQKAKELGNSTKFSATEAASAFTNMSLAGWTVEQSISGIDGVLQLAAASGMGLADASQAVTDNISAFNLQASDASKIADMMAFAQANSSTTAAELAQSYKNCAANMHSAGQDIETTTSILEILANNGLRGAEAGTAVAAMMRDMTSKMEDGSIAIGDANVKVMDSNGNFRDMTDVLKDVEKATKGMGDAEKQAALLSTFTSDSIKGLNMILNTGADTTAEYEEKLRSCSGAAEDMADVMQDNLKGKMTELESATEGLGIAAYEYVSGPLTNAVEGLTTVISGITDSITPQQTTLRKFLNDVEKTTDEVSKLTKNSSKTVDTAKIDVSGLEDYKSKLLELNGVENKNEYQKYQLKSIVEELSASIPELKERFNEEKNSLDLTNQQIEDLISNQERLVMQNAAMEAREEAYKALFDAQLNVVKAENAATAAQEEYDEALKKGNYDATWYEKLTGAYGKNLRTAGNNLMSAKDTQEAANKVLEDAKGNIEDLIPSLNELTKEYGFYFNENGEIVEVQEETNKKILTGAKGFDRLGSSIGENADVLNSWIPKAVEVKENTEELGDTATDSAEKQKEAQQKAADAAKEAAEAQRTAAQEILDAYNSTRESIESSLQNKISLFDLFEKDDGGADVTTEAMNKNLNSQIEAIKKYKENLQKLREMTDEEGKSLVSPEFIQYIESMGMEGANALEHMVWTWENQGEYGAEQVKGISDNYMEAMDLTGEIGKTAAANTIAYKAGMKEFASSAEDFSDLRDAFDYAVQYGGEAWEKLTEDTKTAWNEVVDTAVACGVQIPEGLADSISSGATSPEQAIAMMNEAIKGQFEGLAEIAESCGIKGVDELRKGIEAGGQDAVDAYSDLIELLAANNIDLEIAGKEGGAALGKGTASGIQGESDNTKSTAQQVVETAQKAINDNAGAYSTAGKMLITAMAAGMTFFSYQVSNAAGSAAGNGASAAAGYEENFRAAGNQLAIGLARGIAQGKSQAINEAVSMAVEALNAVKRAMGIHSPSKVFEKEVGAQVAKGMAWGIKSNAVLAKNASTKMSQDVLNSATAWLDKYKERQFTSLDDEKYFWQKVAANTKKGTAAYKKAQQEIAGINKKILNMQTAANKTAGSVSRTKTQGSGSNQKTVNKTDSEYYSEIYSAANKHLSNMKVYYNISIQEEEKYWAAVLKKVKKGTQAYTDAYEQWKNAKKSGKSANTAAAEEKKDYALGGGALDTYKQYFKVSERAEVDYWNTVRKKFKRGTKEREEADKKYFQARKTLNESLKNLEDDYLDKVTDINSKLKDDIQDVTDDLKDSIADVTKETQEKIDELNKTYADSVKSRQETIYNSMRLTDKFQSESESGKTLLYNLKTQVVGYDDWKEQLQKLRDKGIDKDLIKELEDMGPEASAMLHVLNNDLPEGMEGKGMTDAELNEYVALWRKKHEISKNEAEKENEDLKKQTEKGIADAKAAGDAQIAQLNKNSEQKIAVLKANAKKEIQTATEEYLNGVNELEKPMNTSLENLANKAGKIGENTVTKYVQGLYTKVSGKNAKSSLLNTTTTIATNLSTLSKDGEKIGKDTLDGILNAMNDSKKIKKYTTAMVKKIVSETKKAAKIKSPSRLFEDEVGEFIPAGVGVGIEKNTEAAVKPAQEMIRELVESTTGKSMGNITLEQYLRQIDAGAAKAVSTAAEVQAQVPGINVNVDTGNTYNLLSQLISEMQKVVANTSGSTQIVLDTGKLVGEVAKPISQELALQSRAQNRGRF
ncbi:phage tail tape measure protein [Blautia sp. OF03-15BH]|uniref:phage tail tape measure protein n=1 Tax=Blautia sp. OF03-15BH TaxID=2292287 RepID=UPI001314ACEF|nr:phage tail tape measure protein [Blautia sp. OF03-15BH]